MPNATVPQNEQGFFPGPGVYEAAAETIPPVLPWQYGESDTDATSRISWIAMAQSREGHRQIMGAIFGPDGFRVTLAVRFGSDPLMFGRYPTGNVDDWGEPGTNETQVALCFRLTPDEAVECAFSGTPFLLALGEEASESLCTLLVAARQERAPDLWELAMREHLASLAARYDAAIYVGHPNTFVIEPAPETKRGDA